MSQLDTGGAARERAAAIALEGEGRLAEAEAAYRRALALAPEDPLNHRALGELLARLGRYAEAQDEYRRAIELAPDEPVYTQLLDDLLARLERSDQSAAPGAEAPDDQGRRSRGVSFPLAGDSAPVPPTAESPTTASPGEVLRRTPHLEVPGEPLAAGSGFTVEVYTDEEAARAGEVVEGISLAGDEESYLLYVWLLVSEHFELEGEPIRPLRIDRAQPRSGRVKYAARVVESPRPDSEPSIAAVFLHEGRQAGKVERQVRVAGVDAAPAAPGRREPEPAQVGIAGGALAPDLTVLISRPGRGQAYECALSTPHLTSYEVPLTEAWGFPSDASALVNQRMERFAEGGLSPLKRRARLIGAGKALYEDAPELFRRAYGELLAKGPLESILIATEEPAFPWELLVPDGAGDDRPLGVRHSIGRWTHPKQLPTRQRVAVHDAYVIAPDYPLQKRKLVHAGPEVEYVRQTFNAQLLEPPSVEGLDEALATRPAGLLHFVCHGGAPDGSYAQSLYLLHEVEGQPQEEELDDEMLLGLPGVEKGVEQGAPLVFLNACEAGRLLPSLMGTGGLAKAFITQGALAVIAPLWCVRDTLASEIAVSIYEAAISSADVPLAQIVRDVRARTYEEPEAEDSFAAYCFFGDPHTRLEREASA